MDLLDLLDAGTVPDVVHALMPSMATACGLSALQVMDQGESVGRRLYVLGTHGPLEPGGPEVAADCPDCIRAGGDHGGLSAWCRSMQRRQA